MKLSAILTINNRSPEVCQQVADSLMAPGNLPDELIIVLDRCTPDVRDGAHTAYDRLSCPIRWITIPGEPGWRSPVKAWNLGFLAATGDILYCFSSETVQAEGNLARAKTLLAGTPETAYDPDAEEEFHYEGGAAHICLHGSVSCSCGPTGTEVNWNDSAPGNLFCDAAHPRPLGFIWSAPAWAVKQINGYDEEFSKGFWYDDNDFFFRLWNTGLDFLFTDSISGTHLHHERHSLSQQGIATNQTYMLSKHGTLNPLQNSLITEIKQPGKTTWRHWREFIRLLKQNIQGWEELEKSKTDGKS